MGYRFLLGLTEVNPFIGASVLRLYTDGFTENGGFADLMGFKQTYELGTTTLGLRTSARLGNDLPLTIRGMLGRRHAYGDVEPVALLGLGAGGVVLIQHGPVNLEPSRQSCQWHGHPVSLLRYTRAAPVAARQMEKA
ncbi:autotransporter domain-containing protein [Microvirga makkahensis]|uniref:Autotransporter domain-containing protein n=1 Tax=Microvirga makkahensis TaxID=1128670 RepID=A0A7X3MUS5_9HYPH|nr:autotransporter domain-containing protein [Microvirga makkahensis]